MKLAPTLQSLLVTNGFAQVSPDFYTRVNAEALTDPWLVSGNPDAAALIGLSPEVFDTPEFLSVFSGGQPLPGGESLAAVYSGHQFGVWAGQLGDGRALLLGEVNTPAGNWELQLKGSGLTPYSRMGDGKAVLRSSVREYLASEAMAGLGVPTTRALALIASDDPVRRETLETAAMVTRMSPSFVRFGSFEHWASRGEHQRLRLLADYVIDTFYPECRPAPAGQTDHPGGPYLRLLAAVTTRTARLMAAWQCVGFCHGVMNTDNMSILGLTLDYGPFGFMDAFDAHHICNHTDSAGRYAWDAQPAVGHWNLYKLAGALYPLIDDEPAIRGALDTYEADFLGAFHDTMRRKLGLVSWQDTDADLLGGLLTTMHRNNADFTLSFRRLASVDLPPTRPDQETFEDLFIDRDAAKAWLDTYRTRLAVEPRDAGERAASMDRVNPLYILRNHLAELAIRAAKTRDNSEIERLLVVLRDPYTEKPGFEAYSRLPPDWASKLEVSCSS